jgi:hypothetical protein
VGNGQISRKGIYAKTRSRKGAKKETKREMNMTECEIAENRPKNNFSI